MNSSAGIAVAQAFVWDSVGANIGIWEFNPDKCTGLGTGTLLPLEEIAWLFHHVIKAALWQLKVCEWSFDALAFVGRRLFPLIEAWVEGRPRRRTRRAEGRTRGRR